MPQDEIDRGVELYLAFFDEIRSFYREDTGKELELYKETDADCIREALRRLLRSSSIGLHFVVEALHELTWSQCLGNGNHRTAILFVGDLLDSCGATLRGDLGDEAFAASLETWIVPSQAILRRRGEWGYAQKGLEARHREATKRWLKERLGDQSEALATIRPDSLLNFLSGRSSSSERLE